jgi:hypothetical protein
MIDMVMFGALGFLVGCLLALMLAPPLWNRAVRLTTRKLEATMPMSLGDIQADKDQLRAEFAIEVRKVEVALEKTKEKAARELIEANKRRVEIQMLNTELAAAKGQLQENENANRVLQQTIRRRLPDLDSRLKAAKKALADLETVNIELRTTVASQSEALKIARTTLHSQRADIDQLRTALESGSGGGRGWGKSELRAEAQRLTAALSRAQEDLERARTSENEHAFLRRELSRVASQILAAARGQAVHQPHLQPHMMAQAPQSFTPFEPAPAPQEPEADWRHAHGGNGATREADLVEAAVEMADHPEERHAAGGEYEDYAAPEEANRSVEETKTAAEADETAEQRGGLVRRFAARRERRRARKEAGGGTLRARLSGVGAEAPESHS